MDSVNCVPRAPLHPEIVGREKKSRPVRRGAGSVMRAVALLEDDMYRRYVGFDSVMGLGKLVQDKLRYDQRSNVNICSGLGEITNDGISLVDVTPALPPGGRCAVPPRLSKDILTIMACLPYSCVVTYYGEVRTVNSMVSQYSYEWFQAPYGHFVLLYTQAVVAGDVVPRTNPYVYRNFVPPTLYATYCVYGPSSNFIRYQVASKHDGQIYTTNDRTYVMRLGPADGSLNVETWVSAQVYQYAMSQSFLPTNFHSTHYYSTDHYGSWSFENHARQLQSIFSSVDSSVTLVAPGDGIGVVARMWRGPVISGDLNVVPTTSPLVAQETITETLLRSEFVPDKIIILSYVYSFLTDHDKVLISQATCPVVVLDFQHVIEAWGPYVILGPGAVGYRFLNCASFYAERRVKNVPMQYNHNLLSLEGTIELLSVNDVTSYITLLTPGRPYFCPALYLPYYASRGCTNIRDSMTKEFRVKLAAFVSEVVPNLRSHVYFAPIGREVWRIEHVDLELRTLYESRTIYSCDDLPRNEAVLKSVAYYRYGNKLYFYSYHDERREYDFDYSTRLSREVGKIYFDNDPYACAPQKLSIVPTFEGHDVSYVLDGVNFKFKGKFRQSFVEVKKKFKFGQWCESIDYYFRRTMEVGEYEKLIQYRNSLTGKN